MDTNKLETLVVEIEKTYTKLGEQVLTLRALLAEQPTPGQTAKRLLDAWCQRWSARWSGSRYVPNGARDMAALKRLLKDLTPAEIEGAMAAYLKSTDPFYVNARHPLAVFIGSINRHVPQARPPVEQDEEFMVAAVADCRHSPRCRTDQAHTALRSREMRTVGGRT